jgi:hypothetical protein
MIQRCEMIGKYGNENKAEIFNFRLIHTYEKGVDKFPYLDCWKPLVPRIFPVKVYRINYW